MTEWSVGDICNVETKLVNNVPVIWLKDISTEILGISPSEARTFAEVLGAAADECEVTKCEPT